MIQVGESCESVDLAWQAATEHRVAVDNPERSSGRNYDNISIEPMTANYYHLSYCA